MMVLEYTVTFKNGDEETSKSKREILNICKEHNASEIEQVFSKVWKSVGGQYQEDDVEILYDKRLGIDTGIKFKR